MPSSYELHRATMGAYVAQTWGAWNEGVQAALFARNFDPVGRQIVVVMGRDVGAISAQRTAGELFIGNIEILPAYQGRGLGTAIIGELLAQAARDNVPAILQVLKVNPAQRLYRRLGFAPIGDTHPYSHEHAAHGRRYITRGVRRSGVSWRAAAERERQREWYHTDGTRWYPTS